MVEDEPKKCRKCGVDLEKGVMQFVHNAMWFGDDYEETIFSQLGQSPYANSQLRGARSANFVFLYGENKGVEP